MPTISTDVIFKGKNLLPILPSPILTPSGHARYFEVFTVEHQVFIAYPKRFLHQERVLFRFIATFEDLAPPFVMAAFLGMHISRWAPVQMPDLKTVGSHTWGPAVLEEFELGSPLHDSPLQVPKKGGAGKPMAYRKNAWYLPGGGRL